MSIPVEELTENDYLILEYISRFSSIHKTDIEKHFKGKIASLDYRLSVLAQIDYKLSGNVPFPIQNSNYISEEFDSNSNGYSAPRKSLNIFHITDFGKATLQDHIAKKKSDKSELWLKNAWIPIIVSFVTTILTIHIVPKLPLILKWFVDTLSKIFS